MVYAYAYNMGQAYNGKQSAAESCAKHLRNATIKGKVEMGRTIWRTQQGMTLIGRQEQTTVPPFEAGAAPAIPRDQLFMSVVVNSQPSDARVEVDGYSGGKNSGECEAQSG